MTLLYLSARQSPGRGTPKNLPRALFGPIETRNALLKRNPQPIARRLRFSAPGRRRKCAEHGRSSRASISSVDICSGAVENADILSEWLSQAFDSIDYSKVC